MCAMTQVRPQKEMPQLDDEALLGFLLSEGVRLDNVRLRTSEQEDAWWWLRMPYLVQRLADAMDEEDEV